MTDQILKQQMGASHKEFFRLLPLALGSDNFTVHDTQIEYENGNKRVEISLGPEGVRKIALMVIPTTAVEIKLSGFNDQEFKDFMVNFDRAFQRGGG